MMHDRVQVARSLDGYKNNLLDNDLGSYSIRGVFAVLAFL